MALDKLRVLLRDLKIDLEPRFNQGWVRNGAQWFTGYEERDGDKVLRLAYFGDFSRNISQEWEDQGGEKLSAIERQRFDDFKLKCAEENKKERLSFWQTTQVEAEEEWNSFSTIGISPYFDKKKLSGLYGCRLEAHVRGARTIVPARDVDGKLWGYQTIFSEKLDIGDKVFRKGARKEGCFHTLGVIAPNKPIYITEGIATAISVYEALGREQVVVSCFDAGNVMHVARALRSRYKGTRLIICADNDQYPSKDGKIYHTGRVKAAAAVKDVGNAHFVMPHFTREDLSSKPTDFDDLRQLKGLEAVKRQILEPVNESGGLRALEARTPTGLPTKPGEKSVAMAALQYFGADMLVQDRDIFLYGEGYWKHQQPDDVKVIKRTIATLYGPKAGIRDIENAYKYMLIHAPTPPYGRDLFKPEYLAANFQNGSLHFIPNPGGTPTLKFKPHSKADYHISQLPFNFPGLENLNAKNAAWDEMLARIWLGDPDKEAKIRVLAQLMGACLMPCYPKIFFFVGARGSGKSTVMKIINRLIDPKNISRVDPSHFHGFNLDSMVGKLVNMVTDINLHKPIHDDLAKQLTDRVPFRVPRKFQTDLYAPLAPIHIFGGNDLPKSLEGATGAYERRVVILQFGSYSAERAPEGYKLDFDEWVWAQGWEGILAFALRGLIDLAQSQGHFAVPESSKESLKEWDERSDPIGQFLDALEHKELDQGNQYYTGVSAEISRKDLWECFNNWQQTSGDVRAPLSNKTFCGAMRKKGFKEKIVRGVRFWVGVGMTPSGEIEA